MEKEYTEEERQGAKEAGKDSAHLNFSQRQTPAARHRLNCETWRREYLRGAARAAVPDRPLMTGDNSGMPNTISRFQEMNRMLQCFARDK